MRIVSIVFLAILYLFPALFPDSSTGQSSPEKFPNILDIRNIPENPKDKTAFCHSDMGAWYGFGLPEAAQPDQWGGFTGPLLLQQARWMGPSLVRMVISDTSGKQKPSLREPRLVYYPGRIFQSYTLPFGRVSLELIFISSRTALIRIQLDNRSNDSRQYRISWKGSSFLPGTTFVSDGNRIKVLFKKRPEYIIIRSISSPPLTGSVSKDLLSYKLSAVGPTAIGPRRKNTSYLAVSLFQSEKDQEIEREVISKGNLDPESLFKKNRQRWEGYLKSIFSTGSKFLNDPAYRNIAVKCLETLINNWRAPLGNLTHDGLVPSYHPGYFDGFWSWDSWKHAVALVHFDPRLAKDQIRTMFSYQDRHGMVADVVYADKNENNWRDTKPPLSAWAVWKIFEKTGDRDFVSEMYPKLCRYHRWWYRNRDHDQNGLCEYGSTDGTIVAAKWESGMDNAVRFDKAEMVKNNDCAWSMNLESVDLNSYLLGEKKFLFKMAELLARKTESVKFLKDADTLRQKIYHHMFNEKTGYYHDIWLDDKSFHTAFGPEGWIPLWARGASPQQAASVKEIMCDPNKFATFIPFPTVSRDNPEFSTKYWRGPVWLDQAYFAVKALQNYGYREEADAFTRHLLDRPEGLKNSGGAIRENYNPDNGKGLNVHHFSWSAAHLLLLLLGE